MPSADLMGVSPETLEELVAKGFLEMEVRGDAQIAYRLTEQGLAEAEQLLASLPAARAYLKMLREERGAA